MKEAQNKQKGVIFLILLLLVITISAVAISVWAIWFRPPKTVLSPDYAPRAEEEYAQPIDDTEEEKLEQPSGGGAVSLTYATSVSIDLSEENATLYFANPSRSNQDMVLQIAVQDTVIVQSGKLSPGSQVNTLDLLAGAEEQLQPGGYDGKFVVFYYQPETGEKAIVNTEIAINITVNE